MTLGSEPLPSTAVCRHCGTPKPRPGLGFPCPACTQETTWIPYGEFKRLQTRKPEGSAEGAPQGAPKASLDQGEALGNKVTSGGACQEGTGCSGAPEHSKRGQARAERDRYGPESFDPYRGLAVPDCANGEVVHLMCNGCGFVHIQPLTCKRRTCPSCMHVRFKEMLARYGKLARGCTYPKLLTLTLKRGKDPSRMVTRILAAFKALRRREVWDQQKGGAYFLESKPPENGEGWNVHLHVLVDGPVMPQAVLARVWHEITGDSRIVDIRKVSKKGGLAYALGYALKGSKVKAAWKDQPEERKREWETAVKGRRLVQTFGNWWGKGEPKPELTCPECKRSSWYILEFQGASGHLVADQLGLSLHRVPTEPAGLGQRKLELVA